MAFKIGILISGNGSNMVNIVEACKKKTLSSTVEIVICNNPKAKGIKKAEYLDIETKIIPNKNLSTDDFEEKIINSFKEKNVDLICLAGFMKILSKKFFNKWKKHVINIHPSLLPSFKGLNAQKQAFLYGVKYTGCTVHFVDENLDSGKIIGQEVVNISQKDTLQSITRKILKKEHILYINAIRYLEGSIKL